MIFNKSEIYLKFKNKIKLLEVLRKLTVNLAETKQNMLITSSDALLSI